MFDEADLLPVSGLAQLLFCERRWALIQLERLWEENVFTAEGRVMHEKVHEGGAGLREGVRIARGLRLRSLRLGLIGQAGSVPSERKTLPAAPAASSAQAGVEFATMMSPRVTVPASESECPPLSMACAKAPVIAW